MVMEDTVSSDTAGLAYFAVCQGAVTTGIRGASLDLSPGQRRARVERCLETCITQMLRRHETVFTGMMNRLEINRSVNFRLGFNHIAEELFREPVSWSKIVTLFAFGARLGRHCRENHQDDLVEELAANLASFANERISPFVREQGGWVSLESLMITSGPNLLTFQDTLCQVFPPEEDYEAQVWRALVLVGVGLTAASLVMAFRK